MVEGDDASDESAGHKDRLEHLRTFASVAAVIVEDVTVALPLVPLRRTSFSRRTRMTIRKFRMWELPDDAAIETAVADAIAVATVVRGAPVIPLTRFAEVTPVERSHIRMRVAAEADVVGSAAVTIALILFVGGRLGFPRTEGSSGFRLALSIRSDGLSHTPLFWEDMEEHTFTGWLLRGCRRSNRARDGKDDESECDMHRKPPLIAGINIPNI